MAITKDQVEERHRRFLDDLNGSDEAVWLVARWYWKQGYNVRVNARRSAPTFGERYLYSDKGDLEISLSMDVKQLGTDFTCREDWPHRNFIVNQKRAHDIAFPVPLRYLYLNKAGTHFAQLAVGSTREKWKVERKRDRRADDVGGWETDYYVCDPGLVVFGSFE